MLLQFSVHGFCVLCVPLLCEPVLYVFVFFWRPTHLVRVQVRVFLTQAEQERFGVPAQRLFGGNEVGTTDVKPDPAGARLVHWLGRGAGIALHREPKHRPSAAAATAWHPTRAELAAPRRNNEGGRRQAHRAPDVPVLGLLYGASTGRFHNMQLSHVSSPSEEPVAQPYGELTTHCGETASLNRLVNTPRIFFSFWRAACSHRGVAARSRPPPPPGQEIRTQKRLWEAAQQEQHRV